MLKNKIVTIGITSSIAAYKIVELVKLLQEKEAIVRVMMTPKATRFVATGLFEALTYHKVYIEEDLTQGAEHIELAQNTDLFIIAPLSANTLNKFADGIADNLLTTTILATRKPILLCPAMNEDMWESPILQHNLKRLLRLANFDLIEPAKGKLFCGSEGVGRLAETERIALEAQKFFTPQILENKKVLITLGATREKLDPVRFFSNFSSGRTGYALAKSAYLMGAEVTLISGYTEVSTCLPCKKIKVQTAEEMLKTVQEEFPLQDIFVSVAAVSDFRPDYQKQKIKSGGSLKLKFKANPDILKTISKFKTSEQITIGFALETEENEKNALKKLKEKKLDFMIANSPENLGKEEGDYTLISKISKEKTEEIKNISKFEFGFWLWSQVV